MYRARPAPNAAISHKEISLGIHIYVGYLLSRNLALGLMLLAALTLRARGALSTLMVLYACIQFLNVATDCVEGRRAIAPGILILGLLFLMGAARVSGHPFWSPKAWRQAP
jgi:predicted Co/Zn/Cd cation transporter (cation efflux family)